MTESPKDGVSAGTWLPSEIVQSWTSDPASQPVQDSTDVSAGSLSRIRTVERAPDRTLWITTSNGSDDRVMRIKTG